MIKNYFKVAIRNLSRNKVFSFINIFGLSIGICCCLLLALYVHHEMTFDRFHENAPLIYRVKINDRNLETMETGRTLPITTAAVGPSVAETFPEVVNYVRFSAGGGTYFTYNKNTFEEPGIVHTDSTLFDVFSFGVREGDPGTMLSRPNSVVLTSTLAGKIFGEMNPLGEILKLDNQRDLTVTGVIDDFPTNSQLQFSALISFNSLEEWGIHYLDWDGGWNYYTYLLLAPGTDVSELTDKFPGLLEEKINYKYRNAGIILEMGLTPLTDIHLFSDCTYELPTQGSLENIYIFSGIAFFILLIACMNFVNLSTARSSARAKEAGLRKIIGATREKLIGQFLGESMLFVIIAMILSIILIEIIIPYFNNLSGVSISLYSGSGLFIAILLLAILLFTGIAAGAYPAFFLTSFTPVNIIKGRGEIKPGSTLFRNSLVIFQFAVSIGLIAGTFIIYDQLDFIKKKDMGFERENIIGVRLVSSRFSGNWETIKEEVLRIPGVINVAASSGFPGGGLTSNGYLPQGHETVQMFNALEVDNDYFETMGMKIISGRGFRQEFASDDDKYIVNQTLVKQVGWDDPLGMKISRNGDHEIIGIVGDFHFATMHNKINPLIISRKPHRNMFNVLNIRINQDAKASVIMSLNETWNRIDPGEPFHYFFAEDFFDRLYGAELRTGRIFIIFAMLAVMIAGMGLLGLASFLTGQRTKEIAIRKVNGATPLQVIGLLNAGFVRWILVSAVISVPLAWYFMDKWLGNFEYHIEVSPVHFLAAFFITLVISLSTVSFQTFQAAGINPAKALKYE
jgi:putative ABC transport system permease protein